MATRATFVGFIPIISLLITQITAQPSDGSIQQVNGITFSYHEGPKTWLEASQACTNGGLAVFNDEDTLKRVVNWLFDVPLEGGTAIGAQFTAWIGVKSPADDANARTYPGGRILPLSNLWGTGANISSEACAKMVLDPDNEPFMYYNTWQMDYCDDPNVTYSYICMDKTDESCSSPKDACNGIVSPQCQGRTLTDQCVWIGPPSPLPKPDAVSYCKMKGGQLISIYNNGDLNAFKQRFKDDGPFNPYQPWNAIWTSMEQKPGQGAPRYQDGCVVGDSSMYDTPSAFSYDLLNLLNSSPRDVHYGSSLAASGWSIIYFPYFDKWNLYSDAAWNLVDIFFIEYLRGGSRLPFFAYTVCEATKDNFCMYNTPEVMNAEKKEITKNRLMYKCKDKYEFSDGKVEHYMTCGCNATDLQDLGEILSKGCMPKNPCMTPSMNNCEQRCTASTSYSNGYRCSCHSGYELKEDGYTCEDVDECKQEEDRCRLGQYGQCKNTKGSFSCFCQPGFAFGASGECIADQPRVTPGKFEVSFKLTPCAGDYTEDEVKQSLSASVYNIVTMKEFDDMVTVMDITISGSGTMTVVLNIGGAAKRSDHAKYGYFFTDTLSKTGLLNKEGTYCRMGPAFYDAEGLNRAIEMDDLCSVYNAISYCSANSVCVSETGKPMCSCDEGYEGERCDMKVKGPPPSWLTIDLLIIIIALSVLFLMVFVMAIVVYRLWNVHVSEKPLVPIEPIPEPIYGGPYGPLPRPVLGGRGFPGMRRPPMPPVTLPPPVPPPMKRLMPPLNPFARGPGALPRRRMLPPFFGRR